jgi:hypothetical protein
MANKQATIIDIKELSKLRRSLPKSWTQAAGFLRHKKKELERHLKKVHAEWERIK